MLDPPEFDRFTVARELLPTPTFPKLIVVGDAASALGETTEVESGIVSEGLLPSLVIATDPVI